MNSPAAAFAATALIALCRAASAAQTLPPPWLPADPGKAQCRITAAEAELSDGALRFAVRIAGKSVKPSLLENRFAHHAQMLDGELFAVTPRVVGSASGGKSIGARRFELTGKLACEHVVAREGVARAAERRNGIALRGEFHDPSTGIRAAWRAVLRDGTNYVREEVEFATDARTDLASITLIDLQLEGSWVAGTADGSPLIAANNFYGFEHPLSSPQIEDGHATATLRRLLPLRAGVPEKYSAVLGVAPQGQLRRGFQAYLEDERAAPFRTFLHYNSWYDIGFFKPYTEAAAVSAIEAMGQKLVKDRGVIMDSFLFDDGWDDHHTLWQFSKDFPDGFAALRTAAEKYGAEPGIWLSPWGGYAGPRAERLAAANAGGYEVDDQGLALSGQKYYPLFHDVTVNLLKAYGINQFKFDGTGSPDKVTPGSSFDSDFAAAIALISDLRAIKPDLFINLTTGTWPSPFWLRTADSIWRGGEDYGFAGVGSNRQRWITYRDSDLYGGIVRLGPLFPLNSVMLHGIIYAREAPHGLNADPHHDFADEVHDYFATGTGLQELYISANLLNDHDLDVLADSAKWARRNAETLRDSHWIGGDPARLDVYGWASWSPHHAIVALRNPSDRPQANTLDLTAALELPEDETSSWSVSPAFAAEHVGAGNVREVRTGTPITIQLKPFEVLVWDLAPAPSVN